MLNFSGSEPSGRNAQIREIESPYDYGYSVFTWHDSGKGIVLWREQHEIQQWADAFKIATDWLRSDFSNLQ